MFHMPHSQREWLIATASALAGFFGGGASIAFVQRHLKRVL